MRVVLLLVRGLPAGWVGGYGNEWVGTPNLDRLTAAGVTFDAHFANGPGWSLDPVGLTTGGITVIEPADLSALPDPASLCVPALLALDLDDLLPPWNAPAEIFDAYLEDLLADADPAEERPTPLTDIPADYNPADDDARDLLHYSFAAAVTAFDAALGELLDRLEAAGWGDAVWLLTSDRGQELDVGGPAAVAAAQLPLVIRFPGGDQAGRRVPAFTQPADVTATIFGLFGLAPPDGFDLRPLCDGTAAGVRDVVVTAIAGDRAIRTAEWSLVVPAEGEPRVYARPEDRWETTDLRARNVETAEELERRLRSATGGES